MPVFPVYKSQTSGHTIDAKTVVLASLDIFHQSSKHACKVVPVCGDGWLVFTRPSKTKNTFFSFAVVFPSMLETMGARC